MASGDGELLFLLGWDFCWPGFSMIFVGGGDEKNTFSDTFGKRIMQL